MPSFNAKIQKIGINPYVLLPALLLKYLLKENGKDKGPVPVKLKIEGKVFPQTLVKYAGKWRLYINGPMLKQAKANVGDTIDIEIEFNKTPPVEPMHPEFKKALSKNKRAKETFENLTAYRKKEILRYLNFLKTPESIQKNIAKLLKQLSILFICLHPFPGAKAQIVNEFIDLQIHPTMHVPYSFFGKGLEFFDENNAPNLSYQHQFNNVNYANFFVNNPGLRIMVVGSLNSEYISDYTKARKTILKQINYVNDFATKNSEFFVVAKNPTQVREYLKTTSKTIIVHSIEGGKELIKTQEDANFWAEQGISFITLIHLVDCEYGGAAVLPRLSTRVINMDASCDPKNEIGLTELGKNTVIWLANAGIMTDVTHMNDKTRKGVLTVMEEHGIPPLSTHDGFKPVQNHSRALDKEDIIKIYKNGGFISLPVSGFSCMPYEPDPEYQKKIDSLNLYCEGSIDSYKFTYEMVKDYIENKSGLGYNDSLSEAEKVKYAIGFQSDFNGWLNHSRPRYGEEGCYKLIPDSIKDPMETQGLAHPGLLGNQWNILENEGVDLMPIKRSAEKFLQQWQYFLDHKGKF